VKVKASLAWAEVSAGAVAKADQNSDWAGEQNERKDKRLGWETVWDWSQNSYQWYHTIAEDIATRLSYFANGREKEKFLLHIEEFDSVTCLILGLAGRLAKAEENILEQKTEVKEEQMVEQRKRDKLMVQLEEARDLQDNIDRRARKVNCMDDVISWDIFGVADIQIFREIPGTRRPGEV
jgi:hypothetical protein